MSSIEKRDLLEPPRLEMLWIDAIHRGISASSEANRVRFFAAAAHAVRVGTTNINGLFASVVRRNLWDFLSQADEDHGRWAAAAARGL